MKNFNKLVLLSLAFASTLITPAKVVTAQTIIAPKEQMNDGSEIKTAITFDQYTKGGHHMPWLPDGFLSSGFGQSGVNRNVPYK